VSSSAIVALALEIGIEAGGGRIVVLALKIGREADGRVTDPEDIGVEAIGDNGSTTTVAATVEERIGDGRLGQERMF
jgi:hypothetical protein